MKIETTEETDAVNAKFNHFHDGLIKQIRVRSENEFLTDMPWETQRQFGSNEEELQAAGIFFLDNVTVELDIHHFNYNWPNQPRKRAIIIRASSANPSDQLLSFIGREIYDLAFFKNADGISCMLTYHPADAGPVRSMENGITIELFSASLIKLAETEWE